MKEREKLEAAVKAGDVSRVLKIVAASPINSRLAWEAVQEAVEANNEDIIDALLPSLLPTQSAFPLAVAASGGQVSILRKLIPVSNPRADESLALSWAARSGSVEAVEALLPFTDPLASDSNALVHAAREGHAEIVALLIPLSDPKANGNRALWEAATHGHLNIVKLLLPVSSAIVCAMSILPDAAARGATDFIKILLKAKLPDAGDTYATGLDAAATNGHLDTVNVLIPAIIKAGAPRGFGNKAIYEAARAGHTSIVERLIGVVSQSACSHALAAAIEGGKRETAIALLDNADHIETERSLYGIERKSCLAELIAERQASQARKHLDDHTSVPALKRHRPARI
ncbi:ankyrin repeat domain-containing protein [Stenotrophomonas maltophilia]|uniref:Ankyrin repeat domain-containing protein n=1 Tax=Stenotrophomonas maltophilia TaxID=40324 RepID=A0AAI9FYZ7_STEMA|nr:MULTISPECIES: ankyrin repeat domain-containing protein [Stenotrophomonas]KDE88060.1 hypothetical protein DF40_020460 [Stenotrophomonas maltophilia M30]EKT4440971.1 ankyrin repeat domain-containing protein [Stenotrophomonas maltophilia]MBA0458070.1 ankyrin repeat domain-containing protein [Stenotrophomonas maltophilia]WIA59984.1 ankyrin repeat domain-containing protein [Stenotrophomonas sp. BIO128-Bstrain]HDS1821071.1 ankyrin repeat domain-containing protein [Stenotrophomonas maltophilia]